MNYFTEQLGGIMKINIGEDELSGYLNFDPELITTSGIAEHLDSLVEDAEAQEIICTKALQLLPNSEAIETLDYLVSKLRIKGKIIISEVDTYELARLYVFSQIDLQVFNQVIHGIEKTVKTSLTMAGICDYLESKGLKIMKKRINGYDISVEAIRNEH